jgi:hypothetical protein
VKKAKRVPWYDGPWVKIVGLLSAILGIVGFVTTRPADGVEARQADAKTPLESPQSSSESPGEVPAEAIPAPPKPAPAPPEPPPAPLSPFSTGAWTVRLGVYGKNESVMNCTISDGGRFTCPDACGRGKPSSGTLSLDEAGKKLTQTYTQNCGGGGRQVLLYDVEQADRSSIALKRDRDWQNWSLVE